MIVSINYLRIVNKFQVFKILYWPELVLNKRNKNATKNLKKLHISLVVNLFFSEAQKIISVHT